MITDEDGEITDEAIRDMIQGSRSPASLAWDRMRETPGSCPLTVAGEIHGYHWDIPRDAWEAIYSRFGESRALIEIESPARPFAGTPVLNQPDKCLDAWKRWVASLS